MPMQTPFRTWNDETVKDQSLQHQIPAVAFAARRQGLAPKGIKAKLPPQFAAQPTGTPLMRLAQRHLGEPHARDGQRIILALQRRVFLREERHLQRLPVILTKELNTLAPRGLQTTIGLA